MSQQSINLYHIPFDQILHTVEKNLENSVYDFSRHVIQLIDQDHQSLGFIRLPLHVAIGNDPLHILDHQPTILYLSIESGNAALCVMERKEMCYHTTFSAYMSRKKQGFSQIKYLNKKGKSRAGSRVRLAATVEFFENINTSLTALFEGYDFDRIAINCNATLIPYLHQSKVACPFTKKDERLYKIPLHIPKSNFSNLEATIKKLMAPWLFYDTTHEKQITTALSDLVDK